VGISRNDHRIDARLVARDELPDSDHVVGTPGDDEAAVGAEGAAVFLLEGLWECVHTLSVFHAPHFARVVGARADEEAAVGAEGQVVHRPVVAVQRVQRTPLAHGPEPDDLVVAAGRQGLAVRRELGIEKQVAVALELADQRAVGRVPEGRHAPQPSDAGSRHQAGPIRREMNGGHLAGKVLEHA
jgi:hypothetical protein